MFFVFFINDLAQLDAAAPDRESPYVPPPRQIAAAEADSAVEADSTVETHSKNAFEHERGTYGCHYYGFGPGQPGGLEPPVTADELHFGSSRGDGLGTRGDEYLWEQQAPPVEPKHVGSSMHDGLGLRGDEYLWQNKASRAQMDIAQVVVRLADPDGKKEAPPPVSVPSQSRLSAGISQHPRPPMSHPSYLRADPDRVSSGIFGSLPVPSVLPVQQGPKPIFIAQEPERLLLPPPVYHQPAWMEQQQMQMPPPMLLLPPPPMPIMAVPPPMFLLPPAPMPMAAAYYGSGSAGVASPSSSYMRTTSSAPRMVEQYV
jgi:hypothetical protein